MESNDNGPLTCSVNSWNSRNYRQETVYVVRGKTEENLAQVHRHVSMQYVFTLMHCRSQSPPSVVPSLIPTPQQILSKLNDFSFCVIILFFLQSNLLLSKHNESKKYQLFTEYFLFPHLYQNFIRAFRDRV